jgi:hypothetical protein
VAEGDADGLGDNKRDKGKKRKNRLKRYVLKYRYRLIRNGVLRNE